MATPERPADPAQRRSGAPAPVGTAEWAAVDRYLGETLIGPDHLLDGVLAANAAAGLPAHDVAPNQGKLLKLLAAALGARRILEIGTLGAYSTIWLARGLPPGGRIVTLEVDPVAAGVARGNLDRAGVGDRVDVCVGPALDTLAALVSGGAAPFDLVFIDADKPSNPAYLEWTLRLSRPGTVVVADNVMRDGAVADARSTDERVRGVRQFLDRLAADPRLDAAALQTVGSKGWDGFVVALVGRPHG